MECNRVIEMLSAYVDGFLDEQSLELVESHLAECAECSRELDYLRIMLGAASEIEQVQVPAGLRAGIMQAVNESERHCTPVAEMLSSYVDSELSPKQRSHVSAHIVKCKACAEELTELKTLVNAAASIDRIDPPLSLRASILAATVGNENRTQVTRIKFSEWLKDLVSPRYARWAGGSVAAAVLAFGVMLGIPHSPTLVKEARIEQESSNAITSKLTPAVTNTAAQSQEKPASANIYKKHRAGREEITVVAAIPAAKSAAVKPTIKPASNGNGPNVDNVQFTAMEPTEVAVVSEPAVVDKEQSKKKIHEELVKVAVASLVNQENTEAWLKEAKDDALTRKNGHNNASVLNVKF